METINKENTYEVTYDMVINKMKNQISDLMYELLLRNSELEVKNSLIMDLQNELDRVKGANNKDENKKKQ